VGVNASVALQLRELVGTTVGLLVVGVIVTICVLVVVALIVWHNNIVNSTAGQSNAAASG